jgi:Uma2 family endonuclease
MTAVVEAPEKLYTPEELLALPDGDRYELVDGRLVERNMGAESSGLGLSIGAFLWNYNQQHRLGWVLGPDALYACFPNRRKLGRRPDASFVRRSKLRALPKGVVTVVPDLVVEVVSPRDTHSEVSAKVEEYLAVGVPLIWVINPDSRTADIFRSQSTQRLHAEDCLDGEDVLPGFRLSLGELFATAEEPKE